MWSWRSFVIEWKIKGTKKRSAMLLGALFLLFAFVGVFIPIVPQVPFAIISAYFFSIGSPRIHLWMRHNRYFGKPIRDWEDFRIIRPKIKIIATISMTVAAYLGHLKLDQNWAYALDVIFIAAIAFVLTRKSSLKSFIPWHSKKI
jgi:uncharacterized membrane protein YbaN (DUF454 family)